jgi:hypothetical protein
MIQTEFENLKKLIMSWDKANLDLAVQLMKGNAELRKSMKSYLQPLFDAMPDKLRLLKDLHQIPNYIGSIPLNKFNPTDDLKEFLQSMPIQRISFSYRKLELIPSWIFSLKQLRYLLLQDCGIKELPAAIGNLENLEQLNLDQNKLTTIPETIGQLHRLRKLQLDFNQITELPETVGSLSQLEWLCLENNKIEALPKACLQLSNLRWLSIEGTPLGRKYKIRSGMFIQVSSPRFAKFCDVI